MKITGIEIGEYRQFKNIKFDFTYPKGHPKEGQPLEKVCFIGQSGTGKTTLLNIIWNFFDVINDLFWVSNYKVFDNPISGATRYEMLKSSTISLTVNINDKLIFFSSEDFLNKEKGDTYIDRWIGRNKIAEDIKFFNKFCIFIKESIVREADAFLFDQKDQPQSLSDFIKTDTQIEQEKAIQDDRIAAVGSKKVISLGDRDMQSITVWQYLFKDIEDYEDAIVSQIKRIIQNKSKNKVAEELQRWIEADPLIRLAEECLNPILNKFFLEVENTGKIPISLRTKEGIGIPSSNLSTGTRQLLATAIPIYKFDTTDTVILFDEPERSLFPDIQRELIKYYTSLAPKAQFFFATHSPIIASAFEPCERFILYFNKNGEVECRNGIAPIGDDPNDILRQDFGLNELMLDEGLRAYQEYSRLGSLIRQETDEARKNELIADRIELGNQYNF